MSKNQVFRTVRGYQLINQENKVLSSAMEDYLEMIYRNVLEEGYMRINTLSEMLHVKPPSATKMVQKLTQLGFLKYEKYGIIFLTERGENMGAFLLGRHKTIEVFLKNIGVTEEVLVETELIEHSVGSNTLSCIELFNAFYESHPNVRKQFNAFREKHVSENNDND